MNPRNITSAHSIDRIILLFLGRAGYILIRPVQEEGVCAASSLFLFPDPSRARSDRPTLPLSPKMPPAGDDYEPTMGAVQLLVHRRLRTVQKRVAKIAKAEEKRSAGGEIDDQQKELIDGKPVTMALLEEFTKLSQEVVKAVEEDRLAVLRDERAKVAAKAERSAARRAAAAGDRPDEATKANEASAAPPVPPVDGGATRTTGKKQGKRGVRESPADGGAPPAREPTAATSNQPPAEIPQAADAAAAKPRRERGGRGKNRRREGDVGDADARAPASGVFPHRQGPFGAPGVPVGVDGVGVTFGSLGVSGGAPAGAGQSRPPDESVATTEGRARRPEKVAATLPPPPTPPPVEMTPAEINLADYGFDDEFGAPDDLVDDFNDFHVSQTPHVAPRQPRRQSRDDDDRVGAPRVDSRAAARGDRSSAATGGHSSREKKVGGHSSREKKVGGGGGERRDGGGRGRGGERRDGGGGGNRGGGRGGRGVRGGRE